MKFSTKSRYALRLMAELARYAPGTTVSLKEISERQNLSLKYLEQIVTPLARVGLVKSERGSQGGYRLTKAPADYTAGEILRAIEGSVAPIPCLGSQTNECPMSEQCFTLPFWAGLDEVINQYIDSVTLEQLAKANTFVFDKTGTLTAGEFSIRKVLPEEKRDEILRVASLCEQYSNHPISKTIREAVPAPAGEAGEIMEVAGNGITAVVDDKKAAVGNRRLMENQVDIYGLSPVGTTLEETFIEITGGGNIIG